MPWLLLLLSLWGALGTLAAYHPSRHGRLRFVLSFFVGFITIELAPHIVAWQVAGAAVLVALGALDSWPGWLGLAIAVVSWTLLLVCVMQARRSAVVMREVLADLAGDEPGPKVPLVSKLFPLVPFRAGVRVVRNVGYRKVAGRHLKLDVYQPKGVQPGDRRQAVLQIHGGAWVLGDKREQGIPLMHHLAANGWVGFNVNYRLSPGATFPDHLVDLKRALAWIRDHAAAYGADPDDVVVTGGSAGGHLAALMALTANDPRYQPGFEDVDTSVSAAVPFYGVYDLTNRSGRYDESFHKVLLEPLVMKALYADEPEKFVEASPIDQVHPDAPPFLVIHGDRDSLAPVADARLFVERLRAVSSEPVLYAEMHGSQHAFDIFPSIRSAHAIEGVERFLTALRRRRLDVGDEVRLDEEVAETGAEPVNSAMD
jgi:acetyl esterase/lipase